MKKINDFSDINDWGIYTRLSKKHFEQGLDPFQFLQEKYDLQYLVYPITKEKIKLKSKRSVLLFVAIRMCLDRYNKSNQELYSYLTETLLKGYQEKKVSQQQIEEFAFEMISAGRYHFPIVDLMLKNNMLDVNIKNEDGYNLLMHTEVKTSIEALITVGCDVKYKIDNPSSQYHNCNIYDIAIKTKKRTLIKTLENYFMENEKNDAYHTALNFFINEKDITKQMILYKEALKTDNVALIDYIVEHQDQYKMLIEYKDKHGNDIVNHAIKRSNVNVVKKLINLKSIKQYKNNIKVTDNCYLSQSLLSNKPTITKLLYEEKLYNIENVEKTLMLSNYKHRAIVETLINDGYQLNVDIYFRHEVLKPIENLSAEKINLFFLDNSYLLNLEQLEIYNDKIMFNNKRKNGSFYLFSNKDLMHISLEKIKILSSILKEQERLDKTQFEKKFTAVLAKIGNNNEKIGLPFAQVFLKDFPEKINQIVDALALINKQPWLSQINMIKLEGILEEKRDNLQSIKKLKL